MSWTCLHQTEHKARKPHKCCWCGEGIAKGDKYVNIAGIHDGEMQANHYHPECRAASNEFFREYGDDEFMPYGFKRGTTEDR